MVRLIFLVTICASIGKLDAFAGLTLPNGFGGSTKIDTSLRAANRQFDNLFQAAIVAGALSLNVAASGAMGVNDNIAISTPFECSSIQISEAIKTLDMSLPSYDKISNARSTVVGVEEKEAELAERAKERAEKKEMNFPSLSSFSSGSSGSNSDVVSSGTLFSGDKEKIKAEKLAAKAAKKAAEKAADEERERKLKEKIQIVDMDMPTYGSTSAEKNPFRL